jgi:anti-sigma regulatory factor (Ser/Thr protein kinase)
MSSQTKPPEHVKLTIPGLSEYVSVARLLVSGVAARMDFPIEDIEDIKIAFSEAVNNAVQYAYAKPQPDQKVEIEIINHGKKMEMVVTDFGQGFDPANPPAADEKDPHPHLGLGMTFMKSLMDEVSTDSKIGKGTTVRLVKKLR